MMIFYRIYQILVMAPLIVVVTIITALSVIVGSFLGGGNWWGYYPAVIWARIFCWLTFVRVKVIGRENIKASTSYVFVANHQGAYDIFSIYGYLGHKFRWMMKASLRKIPFVGRACEVSRQIYVDKSSPSALRHTMQRAEAVLSNGNSIVVFPEGARSWTGQMRKFKRGAYMLAMEFKLPVVPLTIDGSFGVMPRFKLLPKPGKIVITIHKPIYPPTNGYDIQMLMDETFRAINSALPAKDKVDPSNPPKQADS